MKQCFEVDGNKGQIKDARKILEKNLKGDTIKKTKMQLALETLNEEERLPE